jgi:hypothetical protein
MVRDRGRPAPRRTRPDAVSPWPFVGMGLLVSCLFLYAASGIYAPWWAVVVLLLVWSAFLVLALSWWTPHPTRLPWLAAAAAVVWFVAIVAGARYLGWTR